MCDGALDSFVFWDFQALQSAAKDYSLSLCMRKIILHSIHIYLALMSCFNRSISRGGQVWAPEGSTAFKCLLSARFCAALLSNISDCDETFNYWEPVSTSILLLMTLIKSPVLFVCQDLGQNVLVLPSTDALPLVRHRAANVGVFSIVCHQILRLFMVTCSACLSARPCSTDQQGGSRVFLFFCLVFKGHIFI